MAAATLTIFPIGIACATLEQVEAIQMELKGRTTKTIYGHTFYSGTLEGKDVVVTTTGRYKASAASTVTLMKAFFKVDEMVYVGEAYGDKDTKRGDLWVGFNAVQHDIGATPTSKPLEVVSLGTRSIVCTQSLVLQMQKAAEIFLKTAPQFCELGITSPKLHKGPIGSGEQFVNTPEVYQAIVEKTQHLFDPYPGLKAIDTQSGAVAQTCQELGVSFVLACILFDNATPKARNMYGEFKKANVHSTYALGILREYCRMS